MTQNFLILLFLAIKTFVGRAYTRERYNAMLIVADDLRADIGGWYHDTDGIESNFSYTPNIDAFTG